ncbi:hypothetical protein ACI2KG_14160 [Pseudomonas sp. NPDC089407]|uniref:hypothetical protein n=1 Tax=Pseudomonas sp. NPDC089407 TaxID=3364464 RepID=UPI00384B0DAF
MTREITRFTFLERSKNEMERSNNKKLVRVMKFFHSLLAMLRSRFDATVAFPSSIPEGSSQPDLAAQSLELADPFAGALGLAFLANPASVSPRY